MKKIFLLLVLVAFSGCQADPIRTEASGNPDVKVELIAEFEGIRVYRLNDGGQFVYISDTRNGSRISWETSQLIPVGKTLIVMTYPHSSQEVR